MQIKTFEGTTLKEAIKAVKHEFGHDAVILQTKEKPLGSHAKVYEVTAAAPESKIIQGPGASGYAATSYDQLSPLKEQMETLDIRLATIAENMAQKRQLNSVEACLEELRLLLSQRLYEEDPGAQVGPKAFFDTYQRLKIMGLDPGYLIQLAKYLSDLPEPQKSKDKKVRDNPAEYYRVQAIRWMLKKILIAPRWIPDDVTPMVHVFMGAHGAGKTSVVAKLAAQYKKHHKVKPLLISMDQTRLASAEQLRVYAKILDIAFETLETPDQLNHLLQKHSECKMVFIDSPGQSPKNKHQIQQFAAFNELEASLEKHLVLSITEKQSQLDRCISNFSPVGIQSLIFTKLDESWSYGEIFNLSCKWSLPISFFATGSNIPEDIERATRERIIERIFGV